MELFPSFGGEFFQCSHVTFCCLLSWKGRLVGHTWNAWDCLMATVWSDLPMILNAKWVPEIKRLQMLFLVENTPCYLQSFWINLNSKFYNRESKYHISKYYNGNSKSPIDTPKSSHFKIEFSIIFTIHFGVPLFLETSVSFKYLENTHPCYPIEIFPSSPLTHLWNRSATDQLIVGHLAYRSHLKQVITWQLARNATILMGYLQWWMFIHIKFWISS